MADCHIYAVGWFALLDFRFAQIAKHICDAFLKSTLVKYIDFDKFVSFYCASVQFSYICIFLVENDGKTFNYIGTASKKGIIQRLRLVISEIIK